MHGNFESFDEFVEKLEEIENMGYVKSHRSGNTGIGKTLEDLLGIEENNIPGPDAAGVELKSARRDSGSMMTLFTKEPPRGSRELWASSLVEKYGYEDDDGRPALKVTLYVDEYNNQGFRTVTNEEGVHIEHEDDGIIATYPLDYLRDTYEEKFPEMVLVEADTQTIDGDEYFWYNEAFYLEGFDAAEFLNLIRESIIKIDLRMHLRDSGGARNHGTAFRIKDTSKLDRAFETRSQLIDGIGRDATVTEDPQQGLSDF
ncbi:MvaI/BcnI family restriction endonuclease [Halolamina salifodinae]|uniref:MvaI/BcnI restriction endonuclease domain-containing protein n=1 Tax=Halolamina salifodinae TaxID=1202767 RepID=A0A8T4GV27_9EURY|nr:MvaI/BcnI family restriction endonuclease [Halolamina salifodinae]MBP1986981.1 hypothetical protein [Halolamina salifodinae]